jgi:Kef-type K+ transport system membrane component KefB
MKRGKEEKKGKEKNVMEQFQYHPFLPLGILLIAGYLVGQAANFFRLPRITGYLIAGIALSPSFTNILDKLQIEVLLAFVSTLALSVIAFAIGGGLQVSSIRLLKKTILWISLCQAVGAMLFASLAIYAAGYFSPALRAGGSGQFFSTVIILGAISAATAPAAVLAVIHELLARGPLTTTLLGVVALDDALTIIFFSGAISVAGFILDLGPANMGLFHGFVEISGALVLGLTGGVVLPSIINQRQRSEVNVVVMLGAVLFIAGVSIQAGFSPLLANMTMGFVTINRKRDNNDLFNQLETFEESLYCLFFVLAGAHFDTSVFTTAAFIGIALIIGRFTGKLIGTIVGAQISQAPPVVRKYLGVSLLPKAGLSLGLIFLARPFFSAEAYELLLNAMLTSVIINELIAPPMLKWALTRAGETGSGVGHED